MCFLAAAPAAAGALTATAASSYLTIAGMGLQLFQMFQQKGAADAAAEVNRQIAENRALEYDRNAQQVLLAAEAEEAQVRRETSLRKGMQQATFASNNVNLASGTPANVLADTEAFGELDALTVRFNAEQEAAYYDRLAANERYGGEANYAIDSANADSDFIGGLGSIATSAGQVADKWYQPAASEAAGSSSDIPDWTWD